MKPLDEGDRLTAGIGKREGMHCGPQKGGCHAPAAWLNGRCGAWEAGLLGSDRLGSCGTLGMSNLLGKKPLLLWSSNDVVWHLS